MIETTTVIDILARETSLDPSTLTSASVIRDLGVDSLGMMNVIFGLEEATGIELQVEEMTDVVTIGDLVHLIDNKSTAAASAAP